MHSLNKARMGNFLSPFCQENMRVRQTHPSHIEDKESLVHDS